MDQSLRNKICCLLQELSGCYAFEAEDAAKDILSLVAEEVRKMDRYRYCRQFDLPGVMKVAEGEYIKCDVVLALFKGE